MISLLQREDTSKSFMTQTSKEKDWPVFIENPLVPLMNASKNLVESEGDRFRSSCSTAADILSDSSSTLLSLFEKSHQSLPEELVARAYPAPIEIMPNLETDIDYVELDQSEQVYQNQQTDRANSAN